MRCGGLAAEINTAIAGEVKGLRTCGYSWAETGSRLGITCQATPSNAGEHYLDFSPQLLPLDARALAQSAVQHIMKQLANLIGLWCNFQLIFVRCNDHYCRSFFNYRFAP